MTSWRNNPLALHVEVDLLDFLDVVSDAAEVIWNATLQDNLIIKSEAGILPEVDGCCLPADLAAGGEEARQGGACFAVQALADCAGIWLHLDSNEGTMVNIDEAQTVNLVANLTWESVEDADFGSWALVCEVLNWTNRCFLCSASLVPIHVVLVGRWGAIGLSLPIDT